MGAGILTLFNMEDVLTKDMFVVVTWPESQELMSKEWFDECELINTDTNLSIYGSSAYLVPLGRWETL